MKEVNPPKVFVSYSWTSPEHTEWVLQLAKRLRESDGVDVKIDRWDLKKGFDKFHFMELMVKDKSISKVLMICDRRYKERADDRKGGVGDETQIISSEVYGSVEQDKFIPIVTERDEEGKPYLPVYLGSRVYIDLGEPSTFEENYEELLRVIWDKPLFERPPIGNAPRFVYETSSPSRTTTFRLRAFEHAIRQGKSNAIGLAEDYLQALEETLDTLWIVDQVDWRSASSIIEAIQPSLDLFVEYRDEFVSFVELIARYGRDSSYWEVLHRFFSRATRFVTREYKFGGQQVENFQLLVPELFLYTVVVFLRRNALDPIAYLCDSEFFDDTPSHTSPSSATHSVGVLSADMALLEDIAYRSMSMRVDLRPTVKLLSNRPMADGIQFAELIQADYLLFLRDALSDRRERWTPSIAELVTTLPSPLPVFARGKSHRYFVELCKFLRVMDKASLVSALKRAISSGSIRDIGRLSASDHEFVIGTPSLDVAQ